MLGLLSTLFDEQEKIDYYFNQYVIVHTCNWQQLRTVSSIRLHVPQIAQKN